MHQVYEDTVGIDQIADRIETLERSKRDLVPLKARAKNKSAIRAKIYSSNKLFSQEQQSAKTGLTSGLQTIMR